MSEDSRVRSTAIAALAIFFAAGAVIAFTSGVSLLSPGRLLEPIWRLNPRAREAFGRWGSLSPILLGTVSAACAFTAAGLWRRRLWGCRLAVGLLVVVVNLFGDIANVILGTEPRALVGIPIVLALLVFLGQSRTRLPFRVVNNA